MLHFNRSGTSRPRSRASRCSSMIIARAKFARSSELLSIRANNFCWSKSDRAIGAHFVSAASSILMRTSTRLSSVTVCRPHGSAQLLSWLESRATAIHRAMWLSAKPLFEIPRPSAAKSTRQQETLAARKHNISRPAPIRSALADFACFTLSKVAAISSAWGNPKRCVMQGQLGTAQGVSL